MLKQQQMETEVLILCSLSSAHNVEFSMDFNFVTMGETWLNGQNKLSFSFCTVI